MRSTYMLRLLSLSLVFSMVVVGVALADDLEASGDDLAVVGEGQDAFLQLDFGEICLEDAELDSTVVLHAKRSSGNEAQWWADGAVLTITVDSVNGAGLDADITSDPATITLPDDTSATDDPANGWTSQPTSGSVNRTSDESVEAEITLDPGELTAGDFINGEYEGTVTFKASGNRNGGGSLDRTEDVVVTAQLCEAAGDYVFDGFYAPVKFEDFITAKAGQTIPLKWNLLDDNIAIEDDAEGFDVSWTQTTCPGTEQLGSSSTVEVTSDPASREVRWDATALDGDGQYIYNWKTLRGFAGKCYNVVVEYDGLIVNDELVVHFEK